MQPVRHKGGARPHLGHVRGVGEAVAHEHVSFDAGGVRGVVQVPARVHVQNARVDNHHKLLVASVHVTDKVSDLSLGEVGGVVGPVFPRRHVIDVHPQGVERQVEGGEVVPNVNHVLQLRVAVAALVVAQSPVGHHGWPSNQTRVLRGHGLGRRSVEHKEVDHAANHFEGERIAIGGIQHVHAVRGPQKGAVRSAIRGKREVERVGPVEVGVEGESGHVPGPHCSGGAWGNLEA